VNLRKLTEGKRFHRFSLAVLAALAGTPIGGAPENYKPVNVDAGGTRAPISSYFVERPRQPAHSSELPKTLQVAPTSINLNERERQGEQGRV
jgi:hypothetical protein